MSLNDLIGRRFEFRRNPDGTITLSAKLRSATWLHPDGSIVSLSGEAEVDSEEAKCLPDKTESWGV